MKKILIIGPVNNAHISRLVNNIKSYDNKKDLIIDGFNTDLYVTENNELLKTTYQIKRNFWPFLYSIYIIKNICVKLDVIFSFLMIKEKYDICNIHFPNIKSAVLRYFFKYKSNKIIISPWGSDVLRIDKRSYKSVKRLYAIADIVTVPPIKFRKEVQRIFDVPPTKIVNLGFGSDIIDLLLSSNEEPISSKKRLGLNGKFIITCGYNASPAQNHIDIIKALINLKEQLPNNTILLLPMTYSRNNEYVIKVETLLRNSGFRYLIYHEYLDDITIADIRIATDVFIHIQDTDAYSATLQEFLFTDTIVFNGNWTRYHNLEINGIPYIIVNKISDLENGIRNYLNDETKCNISNECKQVIKELSWSNKGKEWYNFLINYES